MAACQHSSLSYIIALTHQITSQLRQVTPAAEDWARGERAKSRTSGRSRGKPGVPHALQAVSSFLAGAGWFCVIGCPEKERAALSAVIASHGGKVGLIGKKQQPC